MRFSERSGIRKVNSTIQVESMNNELRNGLWNIFLSYVGIPMEEERGSTLIYSEYKGLIERLWFSHFKQPFDTIPYTKSDIVLWLRKEFFSWDWYDVYDFIEFLCKNPDPVESKELIDSFNYVLKRELSGYRFINEELTPISDENQIAEIQKALNDSDNLGLKGVNIHLKSALEKLSDKKAPDYRNSIKESISAIESIVQIISGDEKAELGKALKIIKDKLKIHGALEQGFIKIYGYTSDGDGIRHSLLEETNLDLEDAVYMLISCSAFINYLIVKTDKANIKLK